MKTDDSMFLMCDCNSHALFVEKFKGEPEVYISLFERGYDGKQMSLFERLRWCWRILTHGHPWTDSVILSKDNQKLLTDFINESSKED